MNNRYVYLSLAAAAVVATVGLAYCEIKRRDALKVQQKA